MALSPTQSRPEWAAIPRAVTSSFMVPLQPPSTPAEVGSPRIAKSPTRYSGCSAAIRVRELRSEEHTSELQSRGQLVCRLLLEKKKYMRSATTTAGQSTSNTYT